LESGTAWNLIDFDASCLASQAIYLLTSEDLLDSDQPRGTPGVSGKLVGDPGLRFSDCNWKGWTFNRKLGREARRLGMCGGGSYGQGQNVSEGYTIIRKSRVKKYAG
jgi:hypothetical protein